jgi:prepilin-type N-terminal cleavage/methylation domain-containing protein
MMTAHHVQRRPAASESGFSLVELLISTAIMTVIMGVTMSALMQAMRANETATLLTSMNANLRTGMDLVVRDLLQTGQDLPVGRVIPVPSGAGSTAIKQPGPPGTAWTFAAGTTQLSAVIPGPGRGHMVNGRATDVITFLAADSSFSNVDLDDITDTTMRVKMPCTAPAVCNGINITDGGADDLVSGQLIMLVKGSVSTLVQITGLSGQTATFANGDSLGLNQSTTTTGSLRALNLAAPPLATSAAAARDQTQASRIRMITYYIDATTNPARPALVRRMNNGHPTTFNNNLGTVVAFDVENLIVSYDIANGATNPAHVRMTATDLTAAGACAPDPCSMNQIRKVNVTLVGRSNTRFRTTKSYLHNALSSQVSLRSLSFVDKYTNVGM